MFNISQLINGRTHIESRLATSRVIVFTSQEPQVIRLTKESKLLCDIHDSTLFNHKLILQAFQTAHGVLKVKILHWFVIPFSRGPHCQNEHEHEPHEQYERQNDRILKEKLPRSVGAQYATGDQWRNNSRKNTGMEPQQKQYQLWMWPVIEARSDAVKSNIV